MSNGKKENITASAIGVVSDVPDGVARNLIDKNTFTEISKLNPFDGNSNNFGFTAEHLIENNLNKKFLEEGSNKFAKVIPGKRIQDIQIIDKTTNKVVENIQVKFYGKNTPIDVSKYVETNQTMYVQKDCPQLIIEKMEKQGARVVKSGVYKADPQKISSLRAKEAALTGNKSAPITTNYYKAKNIAKNSHKAGKAAAGKAAAFGGGVSLGSNFVEVVRGDKEIDEAAIDVAIDTAKAGAIGYATTATVTVIGSTAAGTAITGAVGTAGAAVAGSAIGTAIAGSVAGTAVAGAATAVVATTAAATVAGTAAVGTAAAAATATVVGSTVAGAAVIAGGAAIATAAVAAAPFVAAGAIIGGICSLFDW